MTGAPPGRAPARQRHFLVRRGSGPPLLMLVGLGGRAEFWAPQIDRLAGRFTCLCFDHRTDGDRLPADPAALVGAYARDALAVLDAEGIGRADIIGHSLGGAIAQHLAIHAPERVGRLVLSATWAGPTEPFLALFALRQTVLQAVGPRAYLEQGGWLGNPGWWMMQNFAAFMDGVAARLAAFPGVETEMARMAAVTAHDLRARLGEIGAPTLVICARDDAITPLPLSEELAMRIPGARLEILPTGGHFAPVTVPDSYARVIEAHLA
jgi:aminoacrylate hydrolase